jgi:hypothetical protein
MTNTARTSKFSAPVAEAYFARETELLNIVEQFNLVGSINACLLRTTGGRDFQIYSTPIWNMLINARDKVFIDIASWVKAFYSPGGFLRKAQASDLAAFGQDWGAAVPSSPPGVNEEWREAAFNRLFPCARDAKRRKPILHDVDTLVANIASASEALMRDRGDHRAHVFENVGKKSAKRLTVDDVTKDFERCAQVMADLHCLATNASFSGHQVRFSDHDAHAEELVDMLLFGTFRFMLSVLFREGKPSRYFHADREQLYERMRAELGPTDVFDVQNFEKQG